MCISVIHFILFCDIGSNALNVEISQSGSKEKKVPQRSVGITEFRRKLLNIDLWTFCT